MKTALSFFFIIVGLAVFAQQKIIIKGTVINQKNNEKIEDFTVKYFSVSSKNQNTIHPAQSGTFKIAIPYKSDGKYYFIVTAPGYKDSKKSLMMMRHEDDEMVHLKYYLSR